MSNFTSACCTSRLARGNASGRTHREASSNYLCTNDAQRVALDPLWLKIKAEVR